MLLGGIELFLEIQFKPRVSLARPLIQLRFEWDVERVINYLFEINREILILEFPRKVDFISADFHRTGKAEFASILPVIVEVGTLFATNLWHGFRFSHLISLVKYVFFCFSIALNRCVEEGSLIEW